MDCEGFRERMLDVLYDEADEETARLVAEHGETCQTCRDELEGLREVRGTLQAWALPRMRGPVRRFGPPRAFWVLAAAAALVLAVGGAIALSDLSLTFERGPIVVHLGPVVEARPAVAEAPLPTVALPAMTRPAPAPEPVQPVAVRLSPSEREALLRDVAAMIQQSEARQVVAMQTGMTRFEERVALQRRYDWARISAGLSYLDGRTGQQMARTTELMGHVLQVSNKGER